MDILKAYGLVMEEARDIQRSGIKTDFIYRKKTDSFISDSWDLPCEKWVDIVFHIKDGVDADIVRSISKQLGWKGITFDCGGSKDMRQWEIDWSLESSGVPDSDAELDRDRVEDIIKEGDQEE